MIESQYILSHIIWEQEMDETKTFAIQYIYFIHNVCIYTNKCVYTHMHTNTHNHNKKGENIPDNYTPCFCSGCIIVVYFFNVINFILFYFKLFYCCSMTLVCIFSQPLYHSQAKPPSLPFSHPPPRFFPCVLYSNS